MELAAVEARKSLCLSRRCGTVIVKDGEVIGRGYNAPPKDNIAIRSCDSGRPDSCVHAEWRAIIDAAGKLEGATLYFTAVDENGVILKSGEPYCTVCSRLALDSGVAKFVLWQEAGMNEYPTDEYNQSSYANRG